MFRAIVLGIIFVVGVFLVVFYSSPSGRRKWSQQMPQNRRCAHLRRTLLKLARSQETAERLIEHEKRKNPGKPEHWYLEKIIYDFRRGR